ncbi:MAG: threonine/homoserine/homoserine lactone efflux protein [Vicingaceae bacterium]|jgi:threonine/homoserine/homoserine lactone efflux protein
MAIMPGPDNIFVLTESIAKGARNGVFIAFGLNSGVLVHTLAAATGISIILKQSELAFSIIQYAGAAYLLYLAYLSAKEKVEQFETKESNELGAFKLFRTGFIMNLLNPKVSLFFIAFLPQFVRPESGSVTKQMIIMGVAFMVIGFITFSSFALLANQLRKPLNSLKVLTWIKWAKVIVLVGLAVYLFY